MGCGSGNLGFEIIRNNRGSHTRYGWWHSCVKNVIIKVNYAKNSFIPSLLDLLN